jgi:hypothetical protein
MKLNISELRIVEMAVKRYALERAAKLPAGHPELRQLDRFMERYGDDFDAKKSATGG